MERVFVIENSVQISEKKRKRDNVFKMKLQEAIEREIGQLPPSNSLEGPCTVVITSHPMENIVARFSSIMPNDAVFSHIRVKTQRVSPDATEQLSSLNWRDNGLSGRKNLFAYGARIPKIRRFTVWSKQDPTVVYQYPIMEVLQDDFLLPQSCTLENGRCIPSVDEITNFVKQHRKRIPSDLASEPMGGRFEGFEIDGVLLESIHPNIVAQGIVEM